MSLNLLCKIVVTEEGCFGWRGTILVQARQISGRQLMQPPSELSRCALAESDRRQTLFCRWPCDCLLVY
jgi:hypothetical protein